MSHDPADQRRIISEWLKEIEQSTGMTFGHIAKIAGVASSTVYRAANRPDYPHVLSTQTLTKISRAVGIELPHFVDEWIKPGGFAAPEAVPYLYDGPDDFDRLVKGFIGERPGIDPWTVKTRALEAAGTLPGDIAVVDLNASPRAGDVVVAQVYDPATGRAETVWRIYEPPFLMPAARDPRGLKPTHQDNVAIRGVVIGTFRPRHDA